MNIMTADGVKNFYQPATPQFTEVHKSMIKELLELLNRKTIGGWNRKYPGNFSYEVELTGQVKLTHIPQCEHPTVYAGERIQIK